MHDHKKSRQGGPKQIPTRGASACAARDRNSKIQTKDPAAVAPHGMISGSPDFTACALQFLRMFWSLKIDPLEAERFICHSDQGKKLRSCTNVGSVSACRGEAFFSRSRAPTYSGGYGDPPYVSPPKSEHLKPDT